MGIDGASCFHTLTTEQRDIPKIQWDEERFGQLCMKSQAFADFKAELEQACSPNRCTYDQFKALRDFFDRVNTFNVQIEGRK